MKTKIFITIFLLGIVLISGCISQLPSNEKQNQLESISSKLIKISYNEQQSENPHIYKDKMVFQSTDGQQADIYMYDISSGKISRITSDNSNQGSPKIYENKIVWVDARFRDPEIFMYDLSTSEEIRLGVTLQGWKILDFYDDSVIWVDSIGQYGIYNHTIYKYNLKTKTLDIITTLISDWSVSNTTNERAVDINSLSMYDDKIIWSTIQHKDGNTNIFLYDISKNLTKKIIENEFTMENPSIYENKVVWSDNRNGLKNYDIYLYDMEAEKETQITKQQDSSETKPSIYGDKIVYYKTYTEGIDAYGEPNVKIDVFMYDMITGIEKRISSDGLANPYSETKLRVYENKILLYVWSSSSFGAHGVLYLYIV